MPLTVSVEAMKSESLVVIARSFRRRVAPAQMTIAVGAITAAMSILFACATSPTPTDSTTSSSTEPAADGSAGVTDTERDAGPDVASGDKDAAPAASSKCVAKRVADENTCAEECDVRLLLPGKDHYCSLQCQTTSECAALGPGLVCPSTIGACVPSCTANASCTAAGFRRCDVAAGGCDTID